MNRPVLACAALLLLALSGCSYFRASPATHRIDESSRILVLPFENFTETPNAGETIAELFATEMFVQGFTLVPEENRRQILPKVTFGPLSKRIEDLSRELAEEVNAQYVVIGVVGEFHYKYGLNANPAAGMAVQVLDAKTGETVWRGSGSRSGLGYDCVTRTAQRVCRKLVRNMRKAIR